MTTRMRPTVWQPPNETLEAIAGAIAAHWNAAKAYQERWIGPDAGSWLLSALSMSEVDGNAYHFAKGGKLIK